VSWFNKKYVSYRFADFFKNQFVVLFAHIYHIDSEEHQEDKDVWGIEEMLWQVRYLFDYDVALRNRCFSVLAMFMMIQYSLIKFDNI